MWAGKKTVLQIAVCLLLRNKTHLCGEWQVPQQGARTFCLLPPHVPPCLDGEGLAGWEFSLSTDEGL